MMGLMWKFHWDVAPGIKNVGFWKLNLLTWHAPLLMEPTGRYEFWWRTLDRKEWGFYIRIYKRIFCVIWGRYVGSQEKSGTTAESPAWRMASSLGTVQHRYQSPDDRHGRSTPQVQEYGSAPVVDRQVEEDATAAALALADEITLAVTSYIPPPSAAGFVVVEKVKMEVITKAEEYLRLRGFKIKV